MMNRQLIGVGMLVVPIEAAYDQQAVSPVDILFRYGQVARARGEGDLPDVVRQIHGRIEVFLKDLIGSQGSWHF